MDRGGPTYCETFSEYVLDAWLPFIEPLNVITNVAPIIAAFLAFQFMRRRGLWSWPATGLMVLATATGIGSFFWHYTRDPSLLPFDFIPGIFFFLLFAFLWFYALGGRWAGYMGIGALFGSNYILGNLIPGWFSGIFATTALFGFGLTDWTFKKYGREVGFLALLTIGLAALAAFFRTFDETACEYIPTGTHFLWHIGLGTAVYVAIRLYLSMRNPEIV